MVFKKMVEHKKQKHRFENFKSQHLLKIKNLFLEDFEKIEEAEKEGWFDAKFEAFADLSAKMQLLEERFLLEIMEDKLEEDKNRNFDFKIGDWVEWESQASGTTKKKQGRIVEYVYAHAPFILAEVILEMKGYIFKSMKRKESRAREELSYAVLVEDKGRNYLYHPPVELLKKVK